MNLLRKLVLVGWQISRMLLYVMLVVLAPAVRFVLVSAALVGFLVAVFWKMAGGGVAVHLWLMWVSSLALLGLLVLYEVVCRLCAPRG